MDKQEFFPHSQIEVANLRNGPEGDDMIEQIFKGPIDSMIKSALTYIQNTVITEKILKQDKLYQSDFDKLILEKEENNSK